MVDGILFWIVILIGNVKKEKIINKNKKINFIFLSNCSSVNKKIECRIILNQMLNLFLRGDFSYKILYIGINF